jgi:hypothetical protein
MGKTPAGAGLARGGPAGELRPVPKRRRYVGPGVQYHFFWLTFCILAVKATAKANGDGDPVVPNGTLIRTSLLTAVSVRCVVQNRGMKHNGQRTRGCVDRGGGLDDGGLLRRKAGRAVAQAVRLQQAQTARIDSLDRFGKVIGPTDSSRLPRKPGFSSSALFPGIPSTGPGHGGGLDGGGLSRRWAGRATVAGSVAPLLSMAITDPAQTAVNRRHFLRLVNT